MFNNLMLYCLKISTMDCSTIGYNKLLYRKNKITQNDQLLLARQALSDKLCLEVYAWAVYCAVYSVFVQCTDIMELYLQAIFLFRLKPNAVFPFHPFDVSPFGRFFRFHSASNRIGKRFFKLRVFSVFYFRINNMLGQGCKWLTVLFSLFQICFSKIGMLFLRKTPCQWPCCRCSLCVCCLRVVILHLDPSAYCQAKQHIQSLPFSSPFILLFAFLCHFFFKFTYAVSMLVFFGVGTVPIRYYQAEVVNRRRVFAMRNPYDERSFIMRNSL